MKKLNEIKLGRDLRGWEEALITVGELYLVGGVVRNMLFGLEYNELDEDYLVRGIELEKLISILEEFGKTDLVGRSFGVVKFKPYGQKTVDISLPRRERSTGWGHRDFSVKADPDVPVEEDLLRRDFTINSMALDLKDFALLDPLSGVTDIKKRILRVNREESFTEDPLRIIRGVQFYCRFGLKIDKATKELMKRDAELVATVSGERIREEINKMLLLSEKPSKGFELLRETGVLRVIIPELDETFGIEQNEYHPDDIFNHSIKSCDEAPPRLDIKWSALLHDLGKKSTKMEKDGRVVFYGHERESEITVRKVLSRLRFSNRFIDRVRHLVRHHMFNIEEDSSDSAVRRFIARVGEEHLSALFDLRRADAASAGDVESIEKLEGLKRRIELLRAEDSAFKIRDLKINGEDIMGITGLGPGPEIGRIMEALFERVIEEPELNDTDKLKDIVRKEHGRKADK